MRIDRRSILALVAATPALALAQEDPRLAERSVGRADAPRTVIEYYSLTCGHCGAWHRDVFPRVKTELIDPGQLRIIMRDFPLDRLALAAAAVARSLPPERHEAFIGLLLSQQDRWAYARDRAMDELARLAALAGMNRAAVDAAANDEALARGILAIRQRGETEHNVEATPSFVIGGRTHAGAVPFERFRDLVLAAGS